ncbi:MAG: GAF domain-containing protein, partial [Chloroflexi bacterium]|nr:GAF domain-containing protein [Chloroflexota bacterium]
SLSLSAQLDLKALLRAIVDRARHLLDAETGALYFLDAESRTLELVVESDPQPRFTGIRLKLGEGLSGQVAQTGEPLVIEDYSIWPGRTNAFGDPSFRSLLGVPVKWQGQVIGVITVSDNRASRFGPSDLELVGLFADQAAVAISNARLFEESQRQTQELSGLYKTALATSSVLETDVLLSRLHEQVQQLINPDTFVIVLYDPEAEELEIALAVENGERLNKIKVPISEGGPTGWIISNCRPLLIHDMQTDALPVPAWRVTQPARSWLGVPLIARDQTIGSVSVQSFQPKAFTESHRRLLESLAGQIAISLENARLFEATRRQLQELAILKTIATAGTEATSLDSLITRVTGLLGETFYIDHFGILLLDETGRNLQTHDSYRGQQGNVPLNVGITGRVAATGQPWLVADVSQEPAYFNADGNTRSEVCVPLKVGDQVIGVINAESARLDAFSELDLRLLVTISEQLATAIEKVRLFEAERVAREQSEALSEVARTLNSSLDREQVLQTILEQLSRVVEYDSASILLLVEDALEIAAHRGFRSESQLFVPFKMTAAKHVAEAIEKKSTVIIPDTLQDGRWQHFAGAEYIRCWLGVPLLVKDRVIGLLNLDKEETDYYTERHAQLAVDFATQAAVIIENARLYAEARDRAAELGQLYTAAQEIGNSLDLKTVFEQLAKHFTEVLSATSAYVLSVDLEAGTLTVLAEYWGAEASESERKSDLGQKYPLQDHRSFAGVAVNPQITARLASDPTLAESERNQLAEYGIQSFLIIPLIVRGQVIGLAEVWESRRPRAFTPVELRLAETLSQHAASVMENARLLEETSRRAHDMALLNDITRATVATSDLRESLQVLADRLGEIFNADGCYITLWDEERQMPIPSAAYGPLRQQYPAVKVEPGEQTMTASVLRTGHALVAEDVFNSPYISLRIAAMFPAKSMLGLPLMAGDNRLGAALISFHQPHHFTPDEVALGEQAAGQIALAIAKSRLFEATRRSAAELKVASDILRSLNASPQVVSVFPAIASELKALTQCERVSLALITEDRQKVIMAALDQPRTELSQGIRFPLTATSTAPDILKGHLHLTPDLAAEAAYPAEKALYEAGFRSRINLPLRVGDQVIGALNFVWPTLAGYVSVNLSLLEQIADAIALAIEKNRLFDETRRRDVILGALAYASEQLLKPGDLRDELPALLARLGHAAEVSRVYIFKNHPAPDGSLLASLQYEWTAPGIAPQIDNPRLQNSDYLARGATRWLQTLMAGQPIFGLTRDLPPVERATLEPQGILSILIVPIFIGEAWWGYLGFDECTQERIWLGAEVEALKSAAGALGAAFARQRSEAAERRQRELTEALRDTAAAMSSTLNFDEVLERVLANVGRVAPHDAADIMLVNAAGTVRVARCHGYAERGLEEWILSLEFNLADMHNLKHMAGTGKPYTIPDVRNDPDWIDIPQSRWVRSYAGAPILLKGKVIGFINLISGTPDFFTPARADGLKAFVDQVAVAIDNAQLYNEVSALYNASSQLISPGGDLSGLAEQIALSVTREFSFAHCGVLLIDETGLELRRVARAGMLQEMAPSVLPLSASTTPAVAARTGEIVYLPDVTADPVSFAANSETRSELAIPLKVAGKIIGVLDLQSREPGIFDDRTRRIITAFAEHAALALENARLVANLDMSRQMAEDANRLKSEFLANTSHELRTPLTGIIGSLSMVLDGLCDSPEEEREFARIAYTASERLLTIINDVLDIAKIEAGRMDVRLQAVDLDALFKDVRSLSRVQAEEKKLTLEFALPGTMEYILWADPDKLRQVLLNLIGNAIKFTDHGGVRVAASVVDGDDGHKRIRLDVQDTGIGIPLEKQSKLFQPFVQVDGSMTRRFGGTGLGLSISRRLTELMGGALDLSSPGEGLGSTFMVTLPAVSRAELETQ